ncbi:hypothetical protein TrVFT333_003542 [Trichoderma virens FT-333]|nr:hypothetical protein TrVFT333_003542 [Trichoderma virens FT-333]
MYHFMLEPDVDSSCKRYPFICDHIPDVRHLGSKDKAFAGVSRAPTEKIEAYKKKPGWKLPWVLSYGSDFYYDFHVTWDESVTPIEYHFRTKVEPLGPRDFKRDYGYGATEA